MIKHIGAWPGNYLDLFGKFLDHMVNILRPGTIPPPVHTTPVHKSIQHYTVASKPPRSIHPDPKAVLKATNLEAVIVLDYHSSASFAKERFWVKLCKNICDQRGKKDSKLGKAWKLGTVAIYPSFCLHLKKEIKGFIQMHDCLFREQPLTNLL